MRLESCWLLDICFFFMEIKWGKLGGLKCGYMLEQLQVNQTKYFNVHNEIYWLESTSIMMQNHDWSAWGFYCMPHSSEASPKLARSHDWSWLDINLIDSTNESFEKNTHRPVWIDPLLKQHYCSLEPRHSRFLLTVIASANVRHKLEPKSTQQHSHDLLHSCNDGIFSSFPLPLDFPFFNIVIIVVCFATPCKS